MVSKLMFVSYIYFLTLLVNVYWSESLHVFAKRLTASVIWLSVV